MLPVKNDVRCAVFLLNGKVFSAHAVDTDFVQSQEIKGTSQNWLKYSLRTFRKLTNFIINNNLMILYPMDIYE